MKQVTFALLLIASAPALAVTADGWEINARSSVTIGGVSDVDSLGLSGSDTSGLDAVSTSATLLDSNRNSVAAFSSVTSTFLSTTDGNVVFNWGWTGFSIEETEVSTQSPSNTGWGYSFTTGNESGLFSATWSFDVGGSTTSFGLQGVYGGGSAPFSVTPFGTTPVSGTGSFSVALVPFTSYTVAIYNNGNIQSNLQGLNSDTNGRFEMDWSIRTGGAIPEPATWAMLIAGFGLVGCALRHQRRVAAA